MEINSLIFYDGAMMNLSDGNRIYSRRNIERYFANNRFNEDSIYKLSSIKISAFGQIRSPFTRFRLFRGEILAQVAPLSFMK